jgi:hypothetical protein
MPTSRGFASRIFRAESFRGRTLDRTRGFFDMKWVIASRQFGSLSFPVRFFENSRLPIEAKCRGLCPNCGPFDSACGAFDPPCALFEATRSTMRRKCGELRSQSLPSSRKCGPFDFLFRFFDSPCVLFFSTFRPSVPSDRHAEAALLGRRTLALDGRIRGAMRGCLRQQRRRHSRDARQRRPGHSGLQRRLSRRGAGVPRGGAPLPPTHASTRAPVLWALGSTSRRAPFRPPHCGPR